MEELGTTICFSHIALQILSAVVEHEKRRCICGASPKLQKAGRHIVVVVLELVLVLVLRLLGTLGRLDGDFGGNQRLGRRGGTRGFDGCLPHSWRGMTGDMDLSMVGTGH